jgi:hypothetical protein
MEQVLKNVAKGAIIPTRRTSGPGSRRAIGFTAVMLS